MDVTKQIILKITRKYCDMCEVKPELLYVDEDDCPPFTHICPNCSATCELDDRFPLYKNEEVAL